MVQIALSAMTLFTSLLGAVLSNANSSATWTSRRIAPQSVISVNPKWRTYNLRDLAPRKLEVSEQHWQLKFV